MYYGAEYLDKLIDQMRQQVISPGFFLNDLAVLVAFRQLRNPITSMEDITRLQERMYDADFTVADEYDFGKAPSIPIITKYLTDQKMLKGDRPNNLEVVSAAILRLEQEFDIIENTAFTESMLIPRMEANFSFHDGHYIIQAAANIESYTTAGIGTKLFFDFSYYP